MSLVDGALIRPCAAPYLHSPHRRCFPSRRRSCAKVKLGDGAEQEHRAPPRGFSIQVPTIPKLGDRESARRLLESAFQSLSFDMPKIQIDSALQGLPFVIPKLAMPVRVFVLDITGFVATKLKKKRQKRELEEVVGDDDSQQPRCAWPRPLKGMHTEELRRIGSVKKPAEKEIDHQNPVGPHCAWPRATGRLANVSKASLSRSNVPHPLSARPRETIPSEDTSLVGKQASKLLLMENEDMVSCTIDGGPRCSWPRKSIPARQSLYGLGNADNGEKQEASEVASEPSDDVVPSAQVEEVAELPRRLLATSVGLTVMNHLAKGSMVTSVFDLCGLLPAGPMGLSEDEDADIDIGRRTLLVFIKGPTGLA